jgi:hypothetical protein
VIPASHAATSRIHESLDTALARKRVVLWYDPNGEWASEFDDYQPAQADKLRRGSARAPPPVGSRSTSTATAR